jgi:ATP-dependent DNA helicase RecG
MKKSLRTLKGVGEKTEVLFQKIGVQSTDDLLHYYPRDYDTYKEAVDIASLQEGEVAAVEATVTAPVFVKPVRNLSVVTGTVADLSGKLAVTWFNMPYLRTTLKRGSRFVFRGRVARKQSRLVMEQPEIFTPAAYEEILHSLQPIYALTAGLSNKTIVKLIRLVLSEEKLKAEFLPYEIREQYHLADYNYALETIHFPENMEDLLRARERLVFDEFLMFLLSVQLLKEKT